LLVTCSSFTDTYSTAYPNPLPLWISHELIYKTLYTTGHYTSD